MPEDVMMPVSKPPADDSGGDVEAFLNSRGKSGGGVDADKMLTGYPKSPSAPKYQDVKAMQPQEYSNPMEAFGGPAMFLASLGSLMTRHPMKTALDSATAMINGNMKGQQDKAAQARENWKNATEAAIAQNKVETERYLAAMETHKDDVNAAMAKMFTHSIEYNDPLMIGLIRDGKTAEAFNLVRDRQTQAQRTQEAWLKVREQDERERHNRAIEGGAGTGATDPDTIAQAVVDLKRAPPPVNSRRPGDLQLWSKIYEKDPNYDSTNWNRKNAGAASEGRATGSREANLNMILNAAEAAIPAALEASKNVTRYGGVFVPLNSIIQKGEIATSNPQLAEFGMANLQLAEHWARAMNPTGVMRESDRDKALSFLGTATSKETYERMVRQLEKQITRERDSVVKGKGLSAPGAEGGAATGTGTHDLGNGWSVTVH